MSEIALVGEAYGAEEERERTPFVGSSGYLLTKMLEEANISRADCFLTNVFNFRPFHNRLESLYGPRQEAIPGYPPIEKSKYIREEFSSELDRLGNELIEVNPNLVVALGNTALWALCGRGAISKVRGTTCISTYTVEGYKVLPTYHPAAVQRQWELRPVAIADFFKAERESKYPEIRRPKRQVWIEPSLEDLEIFYEQYIKGCEILSVDIENPGGAITEIGFAPSPYLAIVIPFVDKRKKNRSYWETLSKELEAWRFVKKVLEDHTIKKLLQNGLYDASILLRRYGIRVLGMEEDSMLLHHALQPESLKGLGFLASVYCDEGNWKDMRKWTSFKKDD